MNEGQNVRLFCFVRTKLKDGNDNWKTCTWSRHSDGESCRYERKKKDSNNALVIVASCSKLLDRYNFFEEVYVNVRGYQCGTVIPSANQLDNANWTCTITQCKNENVGGCEDKDGNSNTVEDTVNVKVMMT